MRKGGVKSARLITSSQTHVEATIIRRTSIQRREVKVPHIASKHAPIQDTRLEPRLLCGGSASLLIGRYG